MALPPEKTSSPSSKPLQFEPITDGLGFHPFSDGLPYAPMSKTQNARPTPSTGTGARAAGPATFATQAPQPRQPGLPGNLSVPAGLRPQQPAAPARVSVPVASRPAYVPQSPVAQPNPQPRPAAAQLQLDAQSLAELEPSFGFGYLIKRILAFCVDTGFNLALCAGAISVALWKQNLSPELLLNPGIVLLASLFLAVFNWAITTAEEVAFGTSVGKRVFGLALSGSTSAVFLRAFFFLPSACFGGIGLLWALFDRRKRCWHDLVVDLQPIEIAKL